ncbi:hypothetical protein Ppb6_00753 [Photorhabdus australis subsp. thailandensis]|uniref:Uncharacterized protein n=1 Tax=Photorhabdus australis subsp. thailandensis TaxID=2805096 RepID=A0A1C0U7W7_9GAMM|nr:hypothetical protein [Photorhabdus australis]OCQ54028.1 hypothetical protein Ppb6_00753 [Photorhabdus australis subsp. thailandensis]
MNNRDMLFPIIKDDITFDSLFAQAKTVIEQQSGQCWSNTGENDPGITLLEACCYGASDLAYRHALPLRDLLTPKEHERTDDGIFPKEFGPQQILTCGPITAEDYRRALLDLRSDDTVEGYFFFNDAQLIREPENQRYSYWYDKEKREYSFTRNRYSDQLQLTLRGNYWLYLLPSRKTQLDNSRAEERLNIFLKDNRNLGESVSKIIWLDPIELPLRIDIQLDDDAKDIADIFAKVYMMAEQMVLEKPLRYTTQAMKEQGYSQEQIFEGPYLHHGWIPKLPKTKDYTHPTVLNLSPLVNQLLAIKGVKHITQFTLDKPDEKISKLSHDNWSWKIAQGYYPKLWGDSPLELITSPTSPLTITAKGGVKIAITQQQIEKNIITEPLINTQPELLEWGKHRKVLDYYPISNKLPACYGLQTNTQQQLQLHQFMLPFEQMLANRCAELALLPRLLAFKQRGNTVHGIQWPFKENTVGQYVHKDIASKLNNNATKIDNHANDYDKELVILDYLLRYFGAQCAIPRLSPDPPPSSLTEPQTKKDFLSTQREYLAQQPKLTYQRNNIRIDKVSALQKRIAARLGLGGECFKEEPDLAHLPFYLIEHRRLLPVKPDTKFNIEQQPDSLEIDDDKLKITQKDSSGRLLQGQVINLKFSEGYNEFTLLNLMITEVTGDTFTININNSRDLRDNLNKVQNAFKQTDNLSWHNSLIWMEDMDYQLVYANEEQREKAESEQWITIHSQSAFPAMIGENDEITLKIQSDYELKTQVVQLDYDNKKILIRKDATSKNNFPPKQEAAYYSCSHREDNEYGYWNERTYELIYVDTESTKENECWITINDQNDQFSPDIITENDELILQTNPNYQFKTHVAKLDRINRQILLRKNPDLENNFPLEKNTSNYHWHFSGEKYAQTDHFSFVVSVVLNRELIGSGTVDLYKLESWVKTEILSELPAHISLVIHWLSSEEFKEFASTYKAWQNNGAPLGDHAYEILETLTLGKKPSASSIKESHEPVIAV